MKRCLILAGLLMFAALGCSQAPTQQTQANQFDQEFGGFTTSSEAAGFGNASLLASASDEVSPGDPMVGVIQAECGGRGHGSGAPTGTGIALRILWGQMRFDSSSTTPTNWSGKLTAKPGRIGVLRLIRFEPSTDYLLPRTDPSVVEWVSQTTVHNDGLLCLIGLPPPPPPDTTGDSLSTDTLPAPPPPDFQLSFETGPLSISFTLAQLLTLDTLISVDDNGNAVMFTTTIIQPTGCPRGFLGGQWSYNADSGRGEMMGRWMSDDGSLNGHLMGHFGVNSNGRRVFFGKYIDESGAFEGRFRGVWHPESDMPNGGSFKGVFYSPTGAPAGRLHGRWMADSTGVGTFQGVWKTHCPGWDKGARGWARWDDDHFDEHQVDNDSDEGDHGDDGDGQG